MSESYITKKVLSQSFKQLIYTKGFSKITVGDICHECHMNRKSFYYHFKDKYDLVNWIFYTEFLSFVSEKKINDSMDLLYFLCEFFYQNREFYKKTFSIEGQNSFSEYFKEIIEQIIYDDVNELLKSQNRDIEFYALFFTDALTCAIKRWLLSDETMSPDQFCMLIKSCLFSITDLAHRKYGDDKMNF